MKKIILILALFIGLFAHVNAQYLTPAGKTTNIFPLAGDTLTSGVTKTAHFNLGGDNLWIYRAFMPIDYVSGTTSYTLTVQESSTPGDASSWITSTVPVVTKTTSADHYYQIIDTLPTATNVRLKFTANTTVQKQILNAWITPVHYKE